MLDEASREEFTEEEWVEIQQALRDANGTPAPLESITVEEQKGVSDAPAFVTFNYEDGIEETIMAGVPLAVWDPSESGVPKRFLTEEEISELKQFSTSGSTPDADELEAKVEEQAVENAIRGHYEAIGDNNFEEAYSYFGPTLRSRTEEETWIKDEESYDIRSSIVYSVEVEEISGSTATATVDVSFEDNTGNPRFEITWKLVKEGGQWKLDKQLEAEQI